LIDITILPCLLYCLSCFVICKIHFTFTIRDNNNNDNNNNNNDDNDNNDNNDNKNDNYKIREFTKFAKIFKKRRHFIYIFS